MYKFCIPVISTLPSSQRNFSQIDLEKDTLEMPRSSRSSVRDYEPWADRKKQLMMPVFDDCIIYNDNLELAQRYVLINRYNNKRLLHDSFHISPDISQRLPYQGRQ
jgi:hypothetical protein